MNDTNFQDPHVNGETPCDHSTVTKRFGISSRSIGPILLAMDFLSLTASVALAGALGYILSEGLRGVTFHAFEDRGLATSIFVWAALIGGLCLWFGATGHYSTRSPLRSDLSKVWSALIIALLVDGFIQYALRERISRAWLVSIWPIAAILLPVGRVAIRKTLDRLGIWKLRAAIFGAGSHVKPIMQALTSDFYVGYQVVAQVEIAPFLDISAKALAHEISASMRQFHADIIILVPDSEELQRASSLIDALNMQLVPYAIVPPLHRIPLVGLQTQTLLNSDAILMTVRRGLTVPASRAVKRTFDVVAAALLLILLFPVLAIISLLVLHDGRPVIFRHRRIGRGGVPFDCMKFRTMVPGAAAMLEQVTKEDPSVHREWSEHFKLRRDPRITPLGRFLRWTSLDELPQLINVLRGDMSLVGPRPVIEHELSEYYGDDALYYFLVRPGITGLWQTSGRNNTSYERRVQLDAWYVRNWNLWMDIIILLSTLPSMISSRGSY